MTRTRRVGGAGHRAGRASHRTAGLRSRGHLRSGGHLRCGGLLTLSVLFSLLACCLFSRLLTCGFLLSLLACRLSRGSIRSFTVGADLLNRARRIHNAGTARGLVALNTLRGGLQSLLHLSIRQLRVDRLHERHNTGNMRCRHGSALVLGVVGLTGSSLTGVQGGENTATPVAAVATGCAHVHAGAVVREVGALAILIGCAHIDDVLAVAGAGLRGIKVVVTRRDNHDGAALIRLSNRLAVRGGAGALATNGHVNDLGGVLVCRNAAHTTTGSPNNAVGDVRVEAAAGAQNAHGHDLRLGCHAGNALVIVGDSGNGARHVGAVPVGGGRLRAGKALVVYGPVAGVSRVGVAAVTVVGERGLGNEVVAGQHVSVQVRVGGNAGVQHRHGHALAAGDAPRLQRRDALLTGEGPHSVHLRVVDLDGFRGVVHGGVTAHIWRHGGDLGVRAQGVHVLLGLSGGELRGGGDHAGIQRGGADVAGLNVQQLVNALHLGADARVECVVPGCLLGTGGCGPVNLICGGVGGGGVLRLIGVGDDEAVVCHGRGLGGVRSLCRRRSLGCVGGLRSGCRHGGDHACREQAGCGDEAQQGTL